MAYYYDTQPQLAAQSIAHNSMGYYLANSTGSGTRKPYTPPPDEVYYSNNEQSCGSQWAAENAAGLIIGGIGILASGIGIGYLLGSKNDDKPAPTLNSLKNYAAPH